MLAAGLVLCAIGGALIRIAVLEQNRLIEILAIIVLVSGGVLTGNS